MKIEDRYDMSASDKEACLDFCLGALLSEENVIYPRKKEGVLCRKLDKRNWKTENVFGLAYMPNGGY